MVKIKVLQPEIVNELNLEEINNLISQLSKNSSHHNQASFLQLLSQPSLYQFAVFTEKGKIIGLASLFVIQKIEIKTGLVEGVVIDKEYRRRGYGLALMRAVIKQARQLNVKHLDLTSRPGRVAANNLYRKLGFSQRQTNVYRLSLSGNKINS